MKQIHRRPSQPNTYWMWLISLCLIMTSVSCGNNTESISTTPSSKVFALMDVMDNKTTLDDFSALNQVDGLAFRATWAILEPFNDGKYDWTSVDDAFDSVRAQGKQLTLHVGANGVGVPQWLYGLNVTTYTYTTLTGVSVTDPLPWDATYLDRFATFLAALAAHIQQRGDSGLLYAVSDGVPVSEMSLQDCQSGSWSDGTLYDRASYLTAWETTVDAYAAAFPSQKLFISAPVAVICNPDNDGKAFYSDVMNHALVTDSNATVFAADLNALGSQRLAQVDTTIRSAADLAFQMIWSSTNDTNNRMKGTLTDAVCYGINNGARYFEIYKDDITSPDTTIQNAIQTARSLQGC